MRKKFADAFNGLGCALKHRAVRVQILLGLFAIIGGLIIRLDHYEWLAFFVWIAMVIAFEIFNTAIEKIGDYLNEKEDEKIRIIKDLSAAGVLIGASGALLTMVSCILRRLS